MIYVDESEGRRKAQQREGTRRYRQRHPERPGANHARWYQKNKDNPIVREKDLALGRRSYKLRREKQIIALTGGPRPSVCDVCGQGGKICFDHCHETGRFRGWLCSNCNTALGLAKNNPELLRKLAYYLGK